MCPSSFGLNIAHIAGLPGQVIARASTKSDEFKERYKHLFLTRPDIDIITDTIAEKADDKQD